MTTENPEFVKAADVETIVAGKIDAAKAAWLADVDAKIRERNRLGFAGGDKDEDKDGQAAAKAREGALESAFMDYVRTGNRDGLSAAKATMVEGTAANGGYLVPTKYSAELVQTIKEGSVLRAAGARIITVDGTKDFRVPALTNSAAAVLTAESAAYDQKEPTLSEVAFTPYKYTRLSKVSDELLADSRFDVFGQVLAPDGANSFVLAENSAFAVGTGSSQPQGLTVGATVGVTAAATNAITVDEIIDLYYSLKPEYRARATWVVNDATLKVIRKYRESGSTGAFLFQPSLTQGDPSTLMGRPIYSLSTIPTIATGNKAIVFGDLSYFWIADFAGIDMRRLNELYAGSGEVGFRWFKRFDSKVMLAEAVKVLRLA
jgi:HK97 family phage major capsid protein